MTTIASQLEAQNHRIAQLAQRLEAARHRLPQHGQGWSGPAQTLYWAGIGMLARELAAASECIHTASVANRSIAGQLAHHA